MTDQIVYDSSRTRRGDLLGCSDYFQFIKQISNYYRKSILYRICLMFLLKKIYNPRSQLYLCAYHESS